MLSRHAASGSEIQGIFRQRLNSKLRVNFRTDHTPRARRTVGKAREGNAQAVVSYRYGRTKVMRRGVSGPARTSPARFSSSATSCRCAATGANCRPPSTPLLAGSCLSSSELNRSGWGSNGESHTTPMRTLRWRAGRIEERHSTLTNARSDGRGTHAYQYDTAQLSGQKLAWFG